MLATDATWVERALEGTEFGVLISTVPQSCNRPCLLLYALP